MSIHEVCEIGLDEETNEYGELETFPLNFAFPTTSERTWYGLIMDNLSDYSPRDTNESVRTKARHYLEDLQQDYADLSLTLSRISMLACESDMRDLAVWATCEKAGYPEKAALPAYRILDCSRFTYVASSTEEEETLRSLSLEDLLGESLEGANEVRVTNPIASIEEDVTRFDFKVFSNPYLRDRINDRSDGFYHCDEFLKLIPIWDMKRIVDRVRERTFMALETLAGA